MSGSHSASPGRTTHRRGDAMDDDQVNELRRLPGPPPRIGRSRRSLSFREEYGEDLFPVETALMFRCAGHETRLAVKVAEGMWRVTGCHWLRRWDGLLRAVGHGYDVDRVD